MTRRRLNILGLDTEHPARFEEVRVIDGDIPALEVDEREGLPIALEDREVLNVIAVSRETEDAPIWRAIWLRLLVDEARNLLREAARCSDADHLCVDVGEPEFAGHAGQCATDHCERR